LLGWRLLKDFTTSSTSHGCSVVLAAAIGTRLHAVR
jgi:hypothetical protein